MSTKWIRARARLAPADRPGFAIRALAGGDTTEILLYDEIGLWGIQAGDFVRELQMISTPNILVRVNSPGGDVFDGLAIFNALRGMAAGGAKIQTHIDGLAASIASVIALAGDTRTAAENSFFMIHNPWSIVIGDAGDMRQMADTLDKVTGQLIALYAKASGGAPEEIAAMLDAETWLTAQEAEATGFIGAILDEPLHGAGGDAGAEASAEVARFDAAVARFNLSIYRNPPRGLVERERAAVERGAPDGRQNGPGRPQEGPGGGQVDSSAGQEGASARFRRLQQARLSLVEKTTR
jgi:ATP-dependent protease ClpP protease subunit